MVDPKALAAGEVPALDVVAHTIWAESANQPRNGKFAVGRVIECRTSNPGWWGRSWDGVCLKSIEVRGTPIYQFSCWSPSDPVYPKILRVQGSTDPSLIECYAVAATLMAKFSGMPDPAPGSTHYHTKQMSPYPPWAFSSRMKFIAEIADHRFYREV